MMNRLFPLACVLLVTVPAWGATYYVDAESGQDSAAGTSPQAAWKTIQKVNRATFAPGDSILLKRGCAWRENLMPSSAGVRGNPITYSAYGQGPRPRILGSIDKSGETNWTKEGERLWFCAGVEWKENFFKLRQGMIFHDGLGARQVFAKDQLKEDWDWWYDPSAGRAYVLLDHNPGRHAIEVQQRSGVGFADVPFITIAELEIAYADIGVGIWQAEGWVIENCDIHDIVTDAIHANAPADSKKKPRAGIVRNCTFRDWGWKGYQYGPFNYGEWSKNEPYMGYGIHVFNSDDWVIQGNRFTFVNMRGAADLSPIAFDMGGHPILVADNVIDGAGKLAGPSAGLLMWRPTGNKSITVRNNRMMNLPSGISINDFKPNKFTQRVLIENNVLIDMCASDPPDLESIRVWTGNEAPVTIRNNIILRTAAGKNPHAGIRLREARAEVYNNTVVGADNGFGFERGSVVAAHNNISTANRALAAWMDEKSKLTESHNDWHGKVAGFTPDKSDLNADPKLKDPAQNDATLATDSPCVDAGTVVGMEYEGKAPDIGVGRR